MKYRNPIARARGSGSAKTGTQHWLFQRLTAVALVPLAIWFMTAMATLAGADYATAVAWASSPLVAILLIALLVSVFYHLNLGLQVVIEDYVHGEAAKWTALVLVKFACFLAGLAGAYAVLRVSFGGF